jgi:hypothetical protein
LKILTAVIESRQSSWSVVRLSVTRGEHRVGPFSGATGY